jgi:2-iminobutanoate/2-iminopropanoate deaminase
MEKHCVVTSEAPAAVGKYSQGVVVGNFLFTSGQIALIAGEGKTLDNSTVAAETHRVMQNLSAILGAVGCKFADVYRSRIYIADMDMFSEVNAVYGTYFEEGEEPVRECVVAQPPLPGAHVEISMDAIIPTNAQQWGGEYCT